MKWLREREESHKARGRERGGRKGGGGTAKQRKGKRRHRRTFSLLLRAESRSGSVDTRKMKEMPTVDQDCPPLTLPAMEGALPLAGC